jgi:hypothetical protein
MVCPSYHADTQDKERPFNDGGCKTVVPVTSGSCQRRCLSCGMVVERRRRYCSIDCRQRLHAKLDRRTGLLNALNTRYATFYFSQTLVVLTLLPFDSREIFSFVQYRRPETSPGDDFCRLVDGLSGSWWKENQKTQRRYIATRTVLNTADQRSLATEPVQPRETRKPLLAKQSLTILRLSWSDLHEPDCIETIKRAFRTQAMRHHPDKGGRSEMFRKIFTAYQDLLEWAENPAFSTRLGFPDKWFYDGLKNRWLQPTPHP